MKKAKELFKELGLADKNMKQQAHNMGLVGKHYGSKPTARLRAEIKRASTSSKSKAQ